MDRNIKTKALTSVPNTARRLVCPQSTALMGHGLILTLCCGITKEKTYSSATFVPVAPVSNAWKEPLNPERVCQPTPTAETAPLTADRGCLLRPAPSGKLGAGGYSGLGPSGLRVSLWTLLVKH